MKKEIKPIAMRCTKEQFEGIRQRLNENDVLGNNPLKYYDPNDCECYLTNDYEDKGKVKFTISDIVKREIHEEWNEKVFLEACGIETEQEYTITKSQLNELSKTKHGRRKVKEWFPEVFETVFENGYYKHKEGQYPIWFRYINFYTLENYGVNSCGEWTIDSKNMDSYIKKHCEPMTESEVFEALKNEAVKRGFGDNIFIERDFVKVYNKTAKIESKENRYEQFKYYSSENVFENHGVSIFVSGKWAEIIPTITRKEAENKLGVKIVD